MFFISLYPPLIITIAVYCRLTVVNVYIIETIEAIEVGSWFKHILWFNTNSVTLNKNVDYINLLTNLYVFSRNFARLGMFI